MKDLQIGRVLKPQGIKGEIKVEIFDKSMQLDGVERIIVGDEEFYIQANSIRQGYLYLSLEGVDIKKAETLRSLPVYLSGDVAKNRLRKNQYYIDNIINYTVFLSTGENVGSLKEIQEYGAGEVMTIVNSNNKEIMLPVANGVIESIDEDKMQIVLDKVKYEEMSVYED